MKEKEAYNKKRGEESRWRGKQTGGANEPRLQANMTVNSCDSHQRRRYKNHEKGKKKKTSSSRGVSQGGHPH